MEKSIDVNELKRALERNKDAVVVTPVHCDTSSALLNSLSKVVKMTGHHESLLIVDAVLCIGDILIGFDDDIDTLVGSPKGARYSSRTDSSCLRKVLILCLRGTKLLKSVLASFRSLESGVLSPRPRVLVINGYSVSNTQGYR